MQVYEYDCKCCGHIVLVDAPDAGEHVEHDVCMKCFDNPLTMLCAIEVDGEVVYEELVNISDDSYTRQSISRVHKFVGKVVKIIPVDNYDLSQTDDVAEYINNKNNEFRVLSAPICGNEQLSLQLS